MVVNCRVTWRLAWDPTCLLLRLPSPIKNKQNLKVFKSRRQYNLFLENYPAFKGLSLPRPRWSSSVSAWTATCCHRNISRCPPLPSCNNMGNEREIIDLSNITKSHSHLAPRSGTNCIKHFHWMLILFCPIRFDVTIVSIGNNCNVKPDWPESPLGTVVKSNLIGQNQSVNKEILYTIGCWCQGGNLHKSKAISDDVTITMSCFGGKGIFRQNVTLFTLTSLKKVHFTWTTLCQATNLSSFILSLNPSWAWDENYTHTNIAMNPLKAGRRSKGHMVVVSVPRQQMTLKIYC